ncbi:MAG: RNA polymerase sigma factor WhiG [Actinobacteria bacterium]|nr:MAG: RNA polymerase sigma factor WhiG [Actinomycetota bacterium]
MEDPTINELKELWKKFKESPSNDIKDRLIVYYSPLVKYVASRVSASLPPNIEMADLNSYGMFGLIDAIDKFDIKRDIKFETYAMSRIKGAIVDELRSLDWVPRSVRQMGRELEKVYQELQTKNKKAPSDQEIADELDLSLDKLYDLYNKLSSSSMIALEEMKIYDGPSDDKLAVIDMLEDQSVDDPLEIFELKEMESVLGDSIQQLPERERIIVTLYYYEGLTLREIGEILGLTESRVSQLRTKAIVGLKSALKSSKLT